MDYSQILARLYPEGSVGPGVGIYKGQCAVFVETLMQIPRVGDTIATKVATVIKFGYTAKQVQGGYDAGDAIVFDVGTAAGHIAFCNNISNGVMTLSESNWKLDKKIHHTRQISVHDKSIVGCLRGTLLFPMPSPTFNQRVLVICSGIPPANLDQLKSGIQQYADAVNAKTTGLFNLLVDYAAAAPNARFNVVQADATIYLDPQDVAVEAQRLQALSKKSYDVVCLVYDNGKMSPKPNHPVEYQSLKFGFAIMQLPLDWISNANSGLNPLVIFPESVELFFAHELCHAQYSLANARGGAQRRDKTHDQMVLNPQVPSPINYFLNYLLELESWWSALCH